MRGSNDGFSVACGKSGSLEGQPLRTGGRSQLHQNCGGNLLNREFQGFQERGR